MPTARGFTLLEVLIATVIVAILTLALYTSLYSSHKAHDIALAVIAPVRAADHGLDMISMEVQAALPPTGILASLFEGVDQTTGDGLDRDIVRFYAHHDAIEPLEEYATAADVRWVEFGLSESIDDKYFNLTRSVTYNLLATIQNEPIEHIICRQVRSLNFRYYDGTEWLDTWDSSTRENQLPLAVEIRIEINRQRETSNHQQLTDEPNLYQMTRLIIPAGAVEPEATRILW